MKDKLKIVKIVLIVLSIISALNIFLPYAKATGTYKEYLENNKDSFYIEKIGMKNKDAVNMSLFEFSKIYRETANIDLGGVKEESIIRLVLISAIAISSLLVILFAFKNKRALIITFNIIAFISFLLLKYDMSSAKVLPSDSYAYGFAYYLYYVVFILIFAGTIYNIICNKKANKETKTA